MRNSTFTITRSQLHISTHTQVPRVCNSWASIDLSSVLVLVTWQTDWLTNWHVEIDKSNGPWRKKRSEIIASATHIIIMNVFFAHCFYSVESVSTFDHTKVFFYQNYIPGIKKNIHTTRLVNLRAIRVRRILSIITNAYHFSATQSQQLVSYTHMQHWFSSHGN